MERVDDVLDDDAQPVDAPVDASDEPSWELPDAPVTGDDAVDDAVRHLVAAVRAPLEDQLPVLEAVHRTLQDRLADVEG